MGTGLPLQPRSTNLNAFAERWVRTVKEEVMSHVILFGEASLRHVIKEFVAHYHEERPHQGKGNVILMLRLQRPTKRNDQIHCKKRLGGLLKCYYQEAA